MSFFADFFLSVWKVFLQPQNGGTVAQLVEQRTENPRVTGSIPVGTTPKRKSQPLRLAFLFPLSANNTLVYTYKKMHPLTEMHF